MPLISAIVLGLSLTHYRPAVDSSPFLRVSLARYVIRTAADSVVTVEVVNPTREPLVVWDDGASTLTLAVQPQPQGTIRSMGWNKPFFEKSQVPFTISPGRTMSIGRHAPLEFDLKPGKYRIRATYAGPPTKPVKLGSGWQAFTVVKA